jgi:hypothetical protein
VTALFQVIAEFAKQPPRMPAACAVGVDRLPQQAHEQVAATAGWHTNSGQIHGQRAPHSEVIRTEQAMMRHTERLGQRYQITRRPGLPERVQDRRGLTARIISLPGQPYPDPERQR